MNFISTADVTGKELASILSAATLGKKQGWKPKLKGKTVGLLFFNPSLRTRTSFQAGLIKLGSVPIALSATDSWALELIDGSIMDGSTAEHVKDAARVLSTYLDAICIRSFPGMKDWDDDKKDALIQGFAKHATVPVINMESCLWHPCQALADALTMQEVLGKTKG
ncbi:acetylornithine carbamoyltransferase, partial [Candidatus Woesearchaeota archaeon CG11_big_fil_rev_8_21_14_0_20_57_5]